ncbi:undecaprenyl-diphosphatase [Keratinibaculum paraultunense]|uniref:Undecaprenyl-diphosphatase n=1 Tax=Keratinibaculum paraultunense TaxID=1278232 RepID=A0A4R3KQ11_9FIRM|nr:phosphatase PAP2 family protein [Keratinibaculum paraultunense]QQY79370.1 phosphatase PAP2 family protein [Keratinibaculum paraultunense]TCS86611.1 undecaprenyl-diphosphatase [Keratinibaculum paraultunense]
MNRKRLLIISIISITIFIILGINIRTSQEGILFDEIIMDYVHSRTTPLGTNIMKKITYFGSVYFFLPIGIVIFIYMLRKNNTQGILLLILSTLGSYGLNCILKNIFIRTRPLKYFLIKQGGYSFPSGHAMVSMTFYTTMTYLLLKKVNKDEFKRLVWIVNAFIIGVIGFSRIYLGVHWPTDVLMGYLLGYIYYKCIIYIIF